MFTPRGASRLSLTGPYWEVAHVPDTIARVGHDTRVYVDHIARVMAARAAAKVLAPFTPLPEDPSDARIP